MKIPPMLKSEEKFWFGGFECNMLRLNQDESHYIIQYLYSEIGEEDQMIQCYMPVDLTDRHLLQMKKLTN